MEKFRLNGTTVEIIRFIVKQKWNDVSFTETYISTEDELSLVTARLDKENITYEVIDVDTSDCWFLDGETYTGYDEVFAAIEAGEEAFIENIRSKKLAENSQICKSIIETEFKSAVKGDGLQPYRMNEHDQINLSGMQGMINTLLVTGGELPLFSWQNANQVRCVDDWHYSQILGLIGEFGAWKTFVLKRQNEIKERILEAQTAEVVNAVVIDYSDLLNFGGEDA